MAATPENPLDRCAEKFRQTARVAWHQSGCAGQGIGRHHRRVRHRENPSRSNALWVCYRLIKARSWSTGKRWWVLRGGKLQAAQSKFGMLFQGGALFDSLPVWENICFGLLQEKRIVREQGPDIAADKLRMVGLRPDVRFEIPGRIVGRHAKARRPGAGHRQPAGHYFL